MPIDTFLTEARSEIDRFTALEASTGDHLLIDIRPQHNRHIEGEIPGAIVIERIHLEWRLDPVGEHRISGFDADTSVVIVCNEGYASSLAARDLRRIGLSKAADLIGGFRAWRAAGLAVDEYEPPYASEITT